MEQLVSSLQRPWGRNILLSSILNGRILLQLSETQTSTVSEGVDHTRACNIIDNSTLTHIVHLCGYVGFIVYYAVQILLCFRLLEEVLLFTASSGGQLHSTGTVLVQRLLQQNMRVVYAGLAGGPSNSAKLASATLKLLTTMVTQNAGCARDVLAVFDFSCKPMERLPVQQKGSKVSVCEGGVCICALALECVV